MATIKDIAERAGVSRGTVDRVLNGRGEVRRETKARVLRAVKELDYHPNKAGIALAAQKKPYKIGIILFGKDKPFFDDVMCGIEKKQEETSIYGCKLIIRSLPYDVEMQIAAMDELMEEGINGLLISPYEDERVLARIDAFTEQGVPVVTVNTDNGKSKRIAYVGVNALKAGRTAGQLMGMLRSGTPTKVGIVTGSHQVLGHEERVKGFEDVVHESYPNIDIVAVAESQDDNHKGYLVTRDMLKAHPEINAMFFTTGTNFGGCRAIQEAGPKGTYTVITFDELKETVDMINAGIVNATICQEPVLQGYRSLGILIDKVVLNKEPARIEDYTNLVIKIKESLS